MADSQRIIDRVILDCHCVAYNQTWFDPLPYFFFHHSAWVINDFRRHFLLIDHIRYLWLFAQRWHLFINDGPCHFTVHSLASISLQLLLLIVLLSLLNAKALRYSQGVIEHIKLLFAAYSSDVLMQTWWFDYLGHLEMVLILLIINRNRNLVRMVFISHFTSLW